MGVDALGKLLKENGYKARQVPLHTFQGQTHSHDIAVYMRHFKYCVPEGSNEWLARAAEMLLRFKKMNITLRVPFDGKPPPWKLVQEKRTATRNRKRENAQDAQLTLREIIARKQRFEARTRYQEQEPGNIIITDGNTDIDEPLKPNPNIEFANIHDEQLFMKQCTQEIETCKTAIRQHISIQENDWVILKQLLTAAGIYWIQCGPNEEADYPLGSWKRLGLATCSHTSDFDILCHGSDVVRFTMTDVNTYGERAMVEVFEVKNILECLKITMSEFQILCCVLGNDYTEGLPGMGSKRALEAVRSFKTIEGIWASMKEPDKERKPKEHEMWTVWLEQCKQIFQNAFTDKHDALYSRERQSDSLGSFQDVMSLLKHYNVTLTSEFLQSFFLQTTPSLSCTNFFLEPPKQKQDNDDIV